MIKIETGKLFSWMLLSGITSCMVCCHTVQPYQQPDNLITEADYRLPEGTDTLVTDTFNLAELNWRAYYTDPDLQTLIAEALQSNLDLKLAMLRSEEARAYYDRSRKAFLPAAAIGSGARFYKESEPLTGNPRDLMRDYAVAVSTDWEADLWGKLKSAKRSAFARLLEEENVRNAVVSRVLAEIATLYFQLVTLDAKLEVVDKTIQTNELYLATLRQLALPKVSEPERESPAPAFPLKQGDTATEKTINRQSVADEQAQAQIFAAKSYRPQVQAAIFITENALNVLLGRSGGAITHSHTLREVLDDALPDGLGTGIPAQLLASRPDVAAAELRLRQAHELYNVAQAAFYPRLRLTGAIGFEGTRMHNWFDLPSSLIWSAFAGLTQPLFQRGELQTEKRVRALQKEQAFIAFRRQVLTAQREVSDALMRYEANREQARMIFRQYRSLQKAFEYSMELLPLRETSYLDVLSAQGRMFDTEMRLYDSILEVLRQKVELYRALGGGWR